MTRDQIHQIFEQRGYVIASVDERNYGSVRSYRVAIPDWKGTTRQTLTKRLADAPLRVLDIGYQVWNGMIYVVVEERA